MVCALIASAGQAETVDSGIRLKLVQSIPGQWDTVSQETKVEKT